MFDSDSYLTKHWLVWFHCRGWVEAAFITCTWLNTGEGGSGMYEHG